MRALITGATGYVGSHLARRLVETGASVTAIVRPRSDTTRLPRAGVRTEIYDGSLDSLAAAVERARPDCAFHLASVSRIETTRADIDALLQGNITLGVHLLAALQAAPGCRLINTGSYSQFAPDGTYEPDSLYAVTKQAFELFVAYATETDRLAAVTLILFDVYGETDWRSKLLGQLLDSALTAEPLAATDGQQLLDFVHVEDVVDGFMHAARMPLAAEHRRYRLDTGRRVSLRELAATIGRLAGTALDVRWGERPYRLRQKMSVLDRGERLLGWTARIDLEEGLRRCLAARRDARS